MTIDTRWTLAIAAASALLTGCATVQTETVIPAPPAAVWAVLTDAAGYQHWNPVLVKAEGRHEAGQTIRYVMRSPDGAESPIEAEVIRATPGVELNQYGGPWGVLTFDHTWRLEPHADGTRVIQREEYRGIGVWFWDYAWIEPAYARANAALRERVLAGRTPTGATPTTAP